MSRRLATIEEAKAASAARKITIIKAPARRTKPSRIGDAKRNEIRRIVTHVMGAIENNGRVPRLC